MNPTPTNLSNPQSVALEGAIWGEWMRVLVMARRAPEFGYQAEVAALRYRDGVHLVSIQMEAL